ncbi:MAG: alkaline phosphatase [Candidatus Marinimicrobia bacterium]|jgi:alkaline phosphatase|nr:alkaline phosphatase [Candidatus Neomarinimicrobiota bacterium]MBT3635192.1 alkaline phosphatase [Candidatus Neomarinimicrobiota bacterium]MBT3681811.1 alkaline phosphatase [Candidatus Neomarinimicrobiota bacterium]MBT3759538.1 alkaline phosphatase [Candidatus Neomarinimicrobiota bacterium]MBT4172631.1 alkaline phosphatase [Candidatus Neomarinimicrobiota bacterium]
MKNSKTLISLAAISLFIMCSYTPAGLVTGEKKVNSLKGIEVPTNYTIDKNAIEIPESIIFIISDGTGIGQYTLQYYTSEDFAPARFDHVGLVTTHPKDGQKKVTDSAASGTALSAGIKTYNGAIAVDTEKKPVKTMLEVAEDKGMSTGLVATSTISHATPASFGAHIDYRKKEDEISQQLADSEIDVLFGGGSKYWQENLFDQVRENGGQVVSDINEPMNSNSRVVGLFHEEGLTPVYKGREVQTVEMAKKAIDLLDDNSNGFFLMIEESQVDWGGHANSAEYIQGEMRSLNQVVNYCLDYQEKHPNVLVVLTSDHETGGTIVHDGDDGILDIEFAISHHSASIVPIWATGPGAEVFDGFMDNTEIGKALMGYLKK